MSESMSPAVVFKSTVVVVLKDPKAYQEYVISGHPLQGCVRIYLI